MLFNLPLILGVAADCPLGWHRHGESCFFINKNNRLSWAEASVSKLTVHLLNFYGLIFFVGANFHGYRQYKVSRIHNLVLSFREKKTIICSLFDN